jgi:hypothetical protein
VRDFARNFGSAHLEPSTAGKGNIDIEFQHHYQYNDVLNVDIAVWPKEVHILSDVAIRTHCLRRMQPVQKQH